MGNISAPVTKEDISEIQEDVSEIQEDIYARKKKNVKVKMMDIK
jgi:hypothetical protein